MLARSSTSDATSGAASPPPRTTRQPIDEETLLHRTATRVSEGDDVFAALADLAFDLTSQGLPERMPSPRFDPTFWTSQNDTTAFLNYLRHLDRTDIPEVP